MDLNALELVTAIYDYDAQGEDELSLRQGGVIVIISKVGSLVHFNLTLMKGI